MIPHRCIHCRAEQKRAAVVPCSRHTGLSIKYVILEKVVLSTFTQFEGKYSSSYQQVVTNTTSNLSKSVSIKGGNKEHVCPTPQLDVEHGVWPLAPQLQQKKAVRHALSLPHLFFWKIIWDKFSLSRFSITWPDSKSQYWTFYNWKLSFNFLKTHKTTQSIRMVYVFLMDRTFSNYIVWYKTTYLPFILVTIDPYRHLFGVIEVLGMFCGDHLYIHLWASNNKKNCKINQIILDMTGCQSVAFKHDDITNII